MGMKKLSNNNISSIIELYSSGISILVLGEKFNVHPATIWRTLKKNHIRLRDYSSAAKLAIKSGRSKKNKIPQNLQLNEDLSYILGVLAGDGYLDYSDSRETWQIGLEATDKEFVEKFQKTLLNFFKINPTFNLRKIRNKNWNQIYLTKLCSKEACEYIMGVGEFKKGNWKIPEMIKDSNELIKCAFINGFFDSEGEIDKKTGRVGATSMNLAGLNNVGEVLSSLNIRYTIIKKKDLRPNTHQKYSLKIHDQKSITLFRRYIGFNIKRKQDILDYFVSKWDVFPLEVTT